VPNFYHNGPRCVKDDKNILMFFSVHSSNCCSLAKRGC